MAIPACSDDGILGAVKEVTRSRRYYDFFVFFKKYMGENRDYEDQDPSAKFYSTTP
jgi:hypothetical protein